MSVNIEWQAVQLKWWDTSGQSRHAAALRRLFGHENEGNDFVIGKELLERLSGLNVGETDSAFWQEIIDAVELNGAIRVRLVY